MNDSAVSNLRLTHCGDPASQMGLAFEPRSEPAEIVVEYAPTGVLELERATPTLQTYASITYRTPPNLQSWVDLAPALGAVLILIGLAGGWWILLRPKKKRIGLLAFGAIALLGAVIQAVDFNRIVFEPFQTTYREASVCLSGLAPNTEYEYRIRVGTLFSPTQRFATAPARGSEEPFRFVVLGDSRGPHEMIEAGAYGPLVERIKKSAPDLLLNTGDLIKSGGRNEWDAFFRLSDTLIQTAVMHTARGNHDATQREESDRLFGIGEAEATWYSFDYANAHFIILDTEAHNLTHEKFPSPQLAWLERDLSSVKGGWIFVVMHRSLYNSSTRHGSSGWAQSVFVDLFDRFGVDVVFMGHDHIYERTGFLYGREVGGDRLSAQPPKEICDENCERGTVYVTTGGAGAPLYGLENPLRPFSAEARSIHHYVSVSVDGDRLALEAFDLFGNKIDPFGFRRVHRR